jgi:hypothetical protein
MSTKTSQFLTPIGKFFSLAVWKWILCFTLFNRMQQKYCCATSEQYYIGPSSFLAASKTQITWTVYFDGEKTWKRWYAFWSTVTKIPLPCETCEEELDHNEPSSFCEPADIRNFEENHQKTTAELSLKCKI